MRARAAFFGFGSLVLTALSAHAAVNIGIAPTNKYAWSETAGWANLVPTNGGASVHFDGTTGYLTGFAWGENTGWIKLGASAGGPYANTASNNWGVNLNAAGNLSGYAWSETVGWVKFNPAYGGVTVNPTNGQFSATAWGENIGWIKFKGTAPDYNVRTLTFDTHPQSTPNWWLAHYAKTNENETGIKGIPAWQDYVADTDPTDPNSRFVITGISNTPPTTVRFTSSSRRYYTLSSSTNLQSDTWTDVPGQTSIPGAGAVTTLQDTTPGTQRFYRVVATVTNVPYVDTLTPEGMVHIPAGSFVMGAETNVGHESFTGETPQHTVYVNAFYMDRTLVTKAKWDEVATWAATKGYTDLFGDGKATNHPVQMVSWYNAVKWCNARSQKEGLVPCYTNADGTVYTNGIFAGDCNWSVRGYRLPTEAEWEKAARGGAVDHRFPWNDSDEIQHARANYDSSSSYPYDTSPTRGFHPAYSTSSDPYTSPVGSFPANGYGLYDMTGNVYEWCWDRYGSSYYSSSPGKDPRGPATGSTRVARGGGFLSYAVNCRCAARGSANPSGGGAGYDLGFRTVVYAGQ